MEKTFKDIKININGKIVEEKIDNGILGLLDDSVLKYKVSIDDEEVYSTHENIEGNSDAITKDRNGYYHFGYDAAIKEAGKQGMRLPTEDEIKSDEYQNVIVESNIFPGCHYAERNGFYGRGDILYLWGSSDKTRSGFYIKLWKGKSHITWESYHHKGRGYSAWCFKK